MIDRQTNKQRSIKFRRDYCISAGLQTNFNKTHTVCSTLQVFSKEKSWCLQKISWLTDRQTSSAL